MDTTRFNPIGRIEAGEDGFLIKLLPEYIPALLGLDGFSHIQVIWGFDRREGVKLVEEKPYTKGPDRLGAFATRSPNRPNPIALSCCNVTYIDAENGVIGLAYIDAEDASPVFDIKPYTPSLDRVESPEVPAWCAHWPKTYEESGDFDWESEFNF